MWEGIATLSELENYYSLRDVMDRNDGLDLRNILRERARKQQQQTPP